MSMMFGWLVGNTEVWALMDLEERIIAESLIEGRNW
jgi:hypothetical protein